MKKRILTISREFGSGGRSIAKAVADRIGYNYYDNELVTKIAEESGFAKEFIERSGEEVSFSNPFLYNLSVSASKMYGQTSVENQLFITQFNIIKEIAENENSVIVGRCSDYVLRERTDVIHAHIYADEKFRANRIVEVYGEREESPEKRIKDKDKKRKTYYEYYTDRKWGVAKNYNISLDSSVLGIENCIDILVEIMTKDY